jgi:hypothetical protein
MLSIISLYSTLAATYETQPDAKMLSERRNTKLQHAVSSANLQQQYCKLETCILKSTESNCSGPALCTQLLLTARLIASLRAVLLMSFRNG